jgi:ribosome-interacting GTPase 1
VRRKDKGGIAITNTVPLTNIDHEEIHAVCSEYRISNADVAIRQPGATADDLVDVIEGNRYVLLMSLAWSLFFTSALFQGLRTSDLRENKPTYYC